MRDPLGPQARALDDLVTPHFSVRELTQGRGWWPGDPAGEVARYEYAARMVFEPARLLLGVPFDVLSGARPQGVNTGRASSMHLPPAQRLSPFLRFTGSFPELRGAALDFLPRGVPCDVAFRQLDAAQRSGHLPPGGLFWYPPDAEHPGPASGRFLHVDYRPNGLAREAALTPPRSVA